MVSAETMLAARPSLSPRQTQVLALIVGWVEAHGYPPTIREICRHFGFRSTNGVSDHIKALVRKGYLTHEQSKSRTLRPVGSAHGEDEGLSKLPRQAPMLAAAKPARDATPRGARRVTGVRTAGMAGVPMLGRIAAGQPILAPEEARPEDNVWVDQAWLGANDEVYALKVSGDSMIEDGILDGDTVFVRRTNAAERGEVVVVNIDQEVTLKRFFPEGERIRLQPANRRLKPIYLEAKEGQAAQVMGVVIGIYRRL